MTKSTLFWQLRANYMQKKYPTPQPVTTLPSQTIDRPCQLPIDPSMRARQFYKSKDLFKKSKNGEV